MHYRNGREAKNGDKVLQLDFDGHIKQFGVTYDNVPGNDYCNGNLAPVHGVVGTCMVDCFHIEDVEGRVSISALLGSNSNNHAGGYMHFHWRKILAIAEKVEQVMVDHHIDIHGLSAEELQHITQEALTTGKTVADAVRDIKHTVPNAP